MNQKIMASLMIAVIVLVSVHLVIIISEKIEYENREALTFDEIVSLVGPDREVELIRLYPNDVVGHSGGKGTFPGGYTLHSDLANGTRTYNKFLDDGTLLKSIRINDDREKEILILLK